MGGAYLEVILETLADCDRTRLAQALKAAGLDPLPMKVGFLLSADLDSLRGLLPALTASAAGEIPVPESLARSVRAIHVLKPRSLHEP